MKVSATMEEPALVLTLLTISVNVVMDMVVVTVRMTWMYVDTCLPVKMVGRVPTLQLVPMAITASAYQATVGLTVTCQMVCTR